MSKIIFRANIQKFVDSLSPEQSVFLGSLIEQDIQKKDFVLLDQLATALYEHIKDAEMDSLHQKTHSLYSDKIVGN